MCDKRDRHAGAGQRNCIRISFEERHLLRAKIEFALLHRVPVLIEPDADSAHAVRIHMPVVENIKIALGSICFEVFRAIGKEIRRGILFPNNLGGTARGRNECVEGAKQYQQRYQSHNRRLGNNRPEHPAQADGTPRLNIRCKFALGCDTAFQ
jgi:hypothetical protein